MTAPAHDFRLSRPPGRLERRKARTRAAILEAASELFQTRGYDETSIQDIAESADAGVGTVYGYFASKEEILRGVLDAQSDEAVQRYWATVDPAGDAVDHAVTAMRGLAEYIRDNRRVLMAALAVAARSGRVDDQSSQWLLESLTKMLSEGVERGEVASIPVDTTVRALMTVSLQAMLRVGIWDESQDDERTIADLETITRQLLRP